jgi:hypothetical protein
MRICDVCEEICNDVHGLQFSDKTHRYEATGHKECIDKRYEQIKKIKEGNTVQAVLKKLNL